MQQYPAVRALFESDDAVTLTAEEHEALNRYFCLESNAEMIEREYHFYMGQSMMFSYGSMLMQMSILKCRFSYKIIFHTPQREKITWNRS